ncbi:phosphoglycolate phosphatase [Halogeometricum rufum]|uniref:Phosphoglycolate phosphatase n=1 Tax=Halogeometricum rufum TaxID=553469 RepID=A0A1I6I2R2_9EURY|nr:MULTISPECIES: HAD family hydrolase [Halogeometricum]MUV56700.1 HAD-IA family hydrolase [Halogeometricum sp. CBA1124]SFR60918.1 phosphoglycolate phosphatase [Halogeometricum rufum]
MVADAYDFWLFDLDGTVVDADWSYTREVFDRVGDRLGREFTDREAEVVWHGLGGARDPQLRAWGVDPEEFWPAFHAVEDPQARAEATHLHDDAADLLAAVADDRPVGVVTHCQQFLADPVLDHLDLRDWFDAVVCCTEEVGWKPNPAPVYHTMKALGIDPDAGARGVLAGDGSSDIGAAWNAGLDGIHVERHTPERRGRCVLADVRVETFDELRNRRVATDGGFVVE